MPCAAWYHILETRGHCPFLETLSPCVSYVCSPYPFPDHCGGESGCGRPRYRSGADFSQGKKMGPRRTDFRVNLSGLPEGTSWQDLKRCVCFPSRHCVGWKPFFSLSAHLLLHLVSSTKVSYLHVSFSHVPRQSLKDTCCILIFRVAVFL